MAQLVRGDGRLTAALTQATPPAIAMLVRPFEHFEDGQFSVLVANQLTRLVAETSAGPGNLLGQIGGGDDDELPTFAQTFPATLPACRPLLKKPLDRQAPVFLIDKVR